MPHIMGGKLYMLQIRLGMPAAVVRSASFLAPCMILHIP